MQAITYAYKRKNGIDALIIFLLLFPFIATLTPFLQISDEFQSPLYQSLYYYKLVSFVIIIFLYLKRYGICSFDKWILVFIIVWSFSVYLNGVNFKTIVNDLGSILFYCCLVGYYMRKNVTYMFGGNLTISPELE